MFRTAGASENPVSLSELMDIEMPEMAVPNRYTHFTCKPAVCAAPLMAGMLLALPHRVKKRMAQLFPFPHGFVSKQAKSLLWVWYMGADIGSAIKA